MSNLADRIKELRLSKHMTQTDFGNVFGIVKSTISLYESGKSTPNDQIKTKICEYFDVSMDYLLGLTDIKLPYGVPSHSDEYHHLDETVGSSLNYWLSKTSYGYDEIAQMLGITEDLLNDYCSGTEPPPLNILVKLSEICEVSTDCLLGLREKSRKPDNEEMPFRFDPEISRRLKEQAAAMDESNSFLADILGIEENEVFNFFEYGFVPNIMVFVKIVEHFLVSSDYLLNRTGSTLTVQADEDDLLRSYRSLNAKSKTMALSRIYELEREESLVAAKNRYLDSEGKSSPSNGTEGGAMVG